MQWRHFIKQALFLTTLGLCAGCDPAASVSTEVVYGVACKQGRRLQMEDRVDVVHELACNDGTSSPWHYSLFGVYDGHNGSWVAEALAQRLLPSVADALCSPASVQAQHTPSLPAPDNLSTSPAADKTMRPAALEPVSIISLLREQFDAADHHLLDMYHAMAAKDREQQPQDAGSTAVAAMITWPSAPGDSESAQSTKPGQPMLVVAGVGNSRAIVCRKVKRQVAQPERAPQPGRSADEGERMAARLARRRQRQRLHHGHGLEPWPNGRGTQPFSAEGGGKHSWAAVPLTSLHEGSNITEATRVEKEGGSVYTTPGGRVPRLAGDLELTRAFGDWNYRGLGLSSVPDVIAHTVTSGDELLVLATDGLFEVLSPDQLCDHAAAALYGTAHPDAAPPATQPIILGGHVSPDASIQPATDNSSDTSAVPAPRAVCTADSVQGPLGHVAQQLAREAYNRGSGDNLAVVVVDLRTVLGHVGVASGGSMQEPTSCSDTQLRRPSNVAEGGDEAGGPDGDGSGGVCSASSQSATGIAAPGPPTSVPSSSGCPLSPAPSLSASLMVHPNIATGEHSSLVMTADEPSHGAAYTASDSAVVSDVDCSTAVQWPEWVPQCTVLDEQHTDNKHSKGWQWHWVQSTLAKVGRYVQRVVQRVIQYAVRAVAGHSAGGTCTDLQRQTSAGDAASNAGAWLMCGHGAAGGAASQQHRYELTGLVMSVPRNELEDGHSHWHHGSQQAVTPLTVSLLELPSSQAEQQVATSTDTATTDSYSLDEAIYETYDLDDGTAWICDLGTAQQTATQQAAATPEQPSNRVDAKLVVPEPSDPAASDKLWSCHSGAALTVEPSHSDPAHLSAVFPGPGAGLLHEAVLEVGSRVGRGLLMADSDDVPHHSARPDSGGVQPSARLRATHMHDLAPALQQGPQLQHSTQQTGQVETHSTSRSRHDSRMLMSLRERLSLIGHGLHASGWANLKQQRRPVVVREEGARETEGETGHWQLGGRFAAGHFGEVWRAVRRPSPSGHGHRPPQPPQHVVIKRVFAERGEALLEAGLREAYFGALLLPHQQAASKGTTGVNAGFSHLVPFIEAFSTPRSSGADDDTCPDSDGHHHHTPHTWRPGVDMGPPPPPPPRDTCPSRPRDLWLVFEDAGRSLHDLMYEPMDLSTDRAAGTEDGQSAHGFSVLGPSGWWRRLRKESADGRGNMRELLRQLLMALDALQSINITHRDIKVDNLLISTLPSSPYQSGPSYEQLKLTLIDFGSALDPGSLDSRLWRHQGPSDAQITLEYAPPEALFGRYWDGTRAVRPRMWAYDMWSVGVVWLELILGTPDVWSLPPAALATLNRRTARMSALDRASALLLRGLMQWCIVPPRRADADSPQSTPSNNPRTPQAHVPGSRDGQGRSPAGTVSAGAATGSDSRMVPWECTDRALLDMFKSRDPTGLGLGDNLAAIQLLRSLLQWSPDKRPAASEALRHAYFKDS